jgi:hypothetical protein
MRKVPNKKCYRVVNTKTGKVKARCSTKTNATKQLRLLRALENNPRFRKTFRNRKNGGGGPDDDDVEQGDREEQIYQPNTGVQGLSKGAISNGIRQRRAVYSMPVVLDPPSVNTGRQTII